MSYDQRDENYLSSEDESAHYCEVCDKEFPTDESLIYHKQEHAVCNIDGCTFSAHPKLVEKHISMQHRSGLYQKIKNLTTPEDIASWIAERKRKYPTKVNIELQKAEELEKKQRGEIIEQNNKRPNLRTNMKKEFNRNKKRKRRKNSGKDIFNGRSTHSNQLYRGLRPFSGTRNLPELHREEESVSVDNLDDDIDEKVIDKISDDEDQSNTTTHTNINNCKERLSLVADYKSDSDEDNSPEEVPIKRIKIKVGTQECNEQETKSPIHIDKSIAEEIVDEESCDSKDQKDVAKNKHKRLNKLNHTLNSNTENNVKNRKRSSNKLQLLNKLLSRSMQHERNLICQCIKYIVDNNFFDK